MPFLLIFSPVCIILYLSTDRRLLHMDEQFIGELRQQYIQNPPEGMTASLVKNMTDDDLLDSLYTHDCRQHVKWAILE